MKKLIATAIAVLALSSTSFASGGIWITISGNTGQTSTQAESFTYGQSPRDLAGGSSRMATVNAGTSARGAGGGGRAAMRRASDPMVIVKRMDETSSFFVKGPPPAERCSPRSCLNSNAPSAPAPKSIKRSRSRMPSFHPCAKSTATPAIRCRKSHSLSRRSNTQTKMVRRLHRQVGVNDYFGLTQGANRED